MIEFKNIDEYIANFPEDIQQKLQEIRKLIKDIAPNAVETISYAMPTFKLKKNIVHFAAYTNHIGFYPGPSGIETFIAELKEYKFSKGAIQFPHSKAVPFDLIKKITEFRVAENIRGKIKDKS